MICKKPAAVAEHAEAVVSHPVKQNYDRAICLRRTKKPTAKNCTVLARNVGVAKINFVFGCEKLDLPFVGRRDRAAPGMHRDFA